MHASVPLSCVMPACNASRHILSAAGSILAQSARNFELIIVNDGSTDGTSDVLADLARRDPRVRVLHQPHSGIVAALNNGIRAARAPIIARMDADDLATSHRFATQFAYLSDHPDCVLLGSRVTMMDADGRPIGDMVSVAHGHDAIDRALLSGGWPIVHPAVMFRRNAFDRVGGYRDGTCPNEDHDLFLRLAEVGRVENLPDHLLYYRRYLQSTTFVRSAESHKKVLAIVRDALHRRGRDADACPVVINPKPDWWHRREWVWQALREGHVRTARRHAPAIVLDRPWSIDSWRAAYCALRGH